MNVTLEVCSLRRATREASTRKGGRKKKKKSVDRDEERTVCVCLSGSTADQETWKQDLIQRSIPFTQGVTPLEVLADEADIARWKNEGLPADRTSIENAAIVSSCSR